MRPTLSSRIQVVARWRPASLPWGNGNDASNGSTSVPVDHGMDVAAYPLVIRSVLISVILSLGLQCSVLHGATALPAHAEAGLAACGQADAGPSSPIHDITLRGRIVDDRRFPVEGATVRACSWAHPTAVARTDVRGWFTLRLRGWSDDELATTVVRAVLPGRCTQPTFVHGLIEKRSQLINGWPAELELGSLPLSRARTIRANVTRAGKPVPGARVHFEAFGLIEHGIADAEGLLVFESVLPADWACGCSVRAVTDGFAGATHLLGVEPRADRVQVELLPERTVVLEVVDDRTGQPIPDAHPQLRYWQHEDGWSIPASPFAAIANTDVRGTTTLARLCPTEDLAVTVRVPGWEHTLEDARLSEAGTCRMRLGSDQVTTRLARMPSRCWTLSTEEPGGSIAEGPEFALFPRYTWDALEPRIVRASSSRLCLPPELWPDERHSIMRSKEFFADLRAGEPDERLVLKRPRPVDVTLRWDDHTPIVGATVRVTGGAFYTDECWSGKTFTSPRGGNRNFDVAITDAAGHALIQAYCAERALVTMDFGEGPKDYAEIAVVELAAGGARVTETIARPVTVTLEVTVDGERRLPADFSVDVPEIPPRSPFGHHVDPNSMFSPTSAAIAGITEDPKAATISMRLLLNSPSTKPTLYLAAPGFEPCPVLLADTKAGAALAAKASLVTRLPESNPTSR